MTEDIGALEGADVLELGEERTLVLQGAEGAVHVGVPDGDAVEEVAAAVGELAGESGGGDGDGGGLINFDAVRQDLGGGGL